MAKKKNQSRKHKFKYTEPTQVDSQIGGAATSPAAVSKPNRINLDPIRDFSYVGSDLKRISITAVILIILELILWFALNNTALGKAVYGLVSF